MSWRRSIILVFGFVLPLFSARVVSGQLLSTDQFSLYGYLTQAYAISDNYQLMGIPKGGTSDYSRAALLFRYTPSPHDAFVIQLAHRRLGDSPSNAFYSDVLLDWAFYQHTFGTASTVRVGQIPIPLGIFNETRYVGTLLPFFRPSYAFYQEGSFTAETIDGAEFSQRFFTSSRWHLDASLYAGTYNYLQFGTVFALYQPVPIPPDTVPEYIGARAVAKNVLGTQLWLSTPLDGLRFGVAGLRHDDYGGIYFPPNTVREAVAQVAPSIDYQAGRFTARSEYERYLVTGEGGGAHVRQNMWYGQLGYRVLERLSVYVQHEEEVTWAHQPGFLNIVPAVRDNGVSVDYQMDAHIVLKLEGHQFVGQGIEQPWASTTPAPTDHYAIASVSVSF